MLKRAAPWISIACLAGMVIVGVVCVRAAPAARRVKESPLELKSDLENFTARYRIDRSLSRELVIHSSDAGPGVGTVTLLDAKGKELQKIQTGAIQGVRFVERFQRAPLIQVHTEGHGTGFKSREILWYCVDRGKLEEVLNINEYTYQYDNDRVGDGSGEDHMSHSDSQLQIVQATSGDYVFASEPWPILRVRTTEFDWYEDRKTRKLARMSKTKVITTQYEFDTKRRVYAATNR